MFHLPRLGVFFAPALSHIVGSCAYRILPRDIDLSHIGGISDCRILWIGFNVALGLDGFFCSAAGQFFFKGSCRDLDHASPK